jgi:hypothetical protein
MNIYLSQFSFDNSPRFEGTRRITVDGVTFTQSIKFHVDITGYSVIYGVSNGSMLNPKIWWGEFDPEAVFSDEDAARSAVNRALRKAVPGVTPAGKQANHWEQGATDGKLAEIQAALTDERVEVVI